MKTAIANVLRVESPYAHLTNRLFGYVLAIAAAIFLASMCASFPASAQTGPAPTGTSSLIVKLAAGLSADEQAAVIARNGGVEIASVPALRLHTIQADTEQLEAIAAKYRVDPQVLRVEMNNVRQISAVPSDPFYSQQWALPRIGWELIFGNSNPGGTVVVAVLDTGIDATHPDLTANIVTGTSILDASNGLSDASGHGTMVAGALAARTNTTPAQGIAGVAYAGVRLMSVTVLNADGLGQDSDVIEGVVWAADHGASVILMAFSNPGFSASLQEALDYAWSKNIVLVAAAGNEALGTPTYPAGDRGVIGVSATDESDELASFSNYGPSVFLAAPGTNILTTDIGNSYITISGTSTSAAIVAGAAAQMLAIDPTLTNGVIVGRLARTADVAGTQEQTGNGRINLARALLDAGTDFVQPAGAAPVGGGGPFVGPYRAAASATAVAVTSSQNPSVYGAPVTFTATVTCTGGGNPPCANGTPVTVGTLRLGEGNNCQGGFTQFASGTPNAAGQLSVNKADLPAGNHTIRACYTGAGGGTGTGSSEGALSIPQVVNRATTTTTITNTGALSVATVVGQAYVVTYTVTVNGPGAGTPTGSVTVSDGQSTCTGTIAAGQCSLTSTSAGTKTITASYAGDTNFNTSASTGVAHAVNAASTTTTITNTAALGTATIVGQAYPVTYSVAVTNPGTGTPTGSVTVTDGSSSCTATVAAGQCSLTSTSAGTKTITATYAGNSNFVTSVSAGVTHIANPNTFTVTASAVGNGTISPTGSVLVTAGSNQSFTISPSTGYHVADVVVDGASVGAVTSYAFNGVATNHTISANFAINTYTINASAGTNGTINPSGSVAFNFDSTVVFAISPASGYSVSDVVVDGTSVGAVASYTFTNIAADHTITASFADSLPPDTTITAGPTSPTNSQTASFSFTGSDNVSPVTFECRFDNGTFEDCQNPASYQQISDGAHTFLVRAIDQAGNVDPTPAQFTWTVDSAPPSVVLDSMPLDLTNAKSASFTYHSTEENSTFECSLTSVNGGAFASCSSQGASYTDLADGNYTFQVRAIDQAGNPSIPASFAWMVDTTAPVTTIESAPGDPTRSNTATFTFHGDALGGDSFLCQLDDQPATECSSGTVTYHGLGEGLHTFKVTAKDAAGNTDADGETFGWFIDTTAPETSITSGPVDGSQTTDKTASFAFEGADNHSAANNLKFECSLDDAPFAACTSSADFSDLSRKAHTFQVRAIDEAGNVDASPANRSWTITKIPQQITVTQGAPASATYGTSFNVAATGGGSGNPVTIATSGACSGGGSGSALIEMKSGTGTCTVTFDQVGDDDYEQAVQVLQSTVAEKANQTGFALTVPASIVFGSTGTATVSGGQSTGNVTFSSGSAGCAVDAATGVISVTNASQACEISAAKAEDDNYKAATAGPKAVALLKASQTILFGSLSGKTYGDADFALSATASSGLGVSFTASGNCAVSGSMVHLTGAGTCAMNASQPGSDNYSPAAIVSQSFNIAKAKVTIAANSKSKFYSAPVPIADPVLDYQITSGYVVAGDSISGTLVREAGEAIGSYAIGVGTLAVNPSSNYEVTFVPGAFYVVGVTVNVTPSGPQTKTTPFTVQVMTGTPYPITCTIDWGDVLPPNAPHMSSSSGNNGSCTFSNTYGAAAVYEPKVSVSSTNIAGTGTATYQYIVVYDPSAGFVTGGGWIMSPEGASSQYPSAKGKANFGFNSKYQKGANVPSGDTQFQFQAGNLNFKSKDYQWLVIAGSKAQYKGSGTVNGTGDYGFILTAIDGDLKGGAADGLDRFRIKIWDNNNNGVVVYDNQMGAADTDDPTTAIAGGSIVIHK